MTRRILSTLFITALTVAAFAQGGGSLWWGYHHDSDVPDNHLGLGMPVVYEAAIFVSGETAPTAGASIEAVRLPFTGTEHIDSVSVWFTNSLEKNERVVTISIDLGKPVEGWNTVQVPYPQRISIGDKGIYVGYTFHVTALDGQSERPLVMCDAINDGGLWLRVASVNGYQNWMNTRRYGSLAMQLQLTGGSLQACSASADAIRSYNVVHQTDDQLDLMLSNYGTEPVSSLQYSYAFGNETKTGSYTLAEPLTNVYGKQTFVTLPIQAPDATGRMPLSFTLTGVNGEPNACAANQAQTDVLSLHHKAHHRTVMEEYTGTWCSACPRGFAGIARLKKMYPDDFIAVSVHVLNGDPMDVYYDYYYVMNATQFPSCRFDRGALTDPYDGDITDGHFHADENFRQANRILAPADLKVEAWWTGDSVCAIRSTTDFAYDADECSYKMVYILIEDSLTGPDDDHSWHQKNSFTDPSMAYYVEDDMQQYVNAEGTMLHGVVYNDVVISMSDLRGIDGSLTGPQRVGQPMTHDYSLSLTPVSQNRRNAHIVALLIDSQTKLVANAAICDITTPDAIHNSQFIVHSSQSTVYDLQGRRIGNAQQKGLRIVRMADGTVRKQFNR
jgi:hypothetical protein